MHRWASFLGVSSSSSSAALSRASTGLAAARAWRAYYRAVHNNTHAIEYSGEIQVGGQNFTALFDSGSDRIILPSTDCVSDACQTHRLYDASKSRTKTNLTDPQPAELTYGAGSAIGYEAEDVICIGGACGKADFVTALEESDQPFKTSQFDGVVGLSLALRSDNSRTTSALDALVDAGAIPREQFSVFMSKDLHTDGSEISFGEADPTRADGPTFWTNVSEPGYWQVSLGELSVGGKRLEFCDGANSGTLKNGTNVSSFFGKMCCRSLDEFDHEQRCQFDDTYTGWRSRYTDSGIVLADYPDRRVAVKLHDGCVQKVPRKWLSLPNGCRGDGTIQAVLDTGSSLVMGPRPIVDKILAAVGAKENCTAQNRTTFPTISMTLQEGNQSLSLSPEDYMDTVALADGVYCWPHFLSTPATAKGAVMILGMPFLRAYYTTFDAAGKRVGFAKARQLSQKPALVSNKGKHLRAVALHGNRPQSFDGTLTSALKVEHWTG